MTWTNVPKPTTSNYTNVNVIGKQQYDQATITYDDSSTYYDGLNPFLWTDVSKPTTSYTWDSLTVSWNSFTHPWQSPTWTLVNKPT